MSTSYIPGTCNLGKAEVQRRQRTAYFGFALSFIVAVVLVAINASTSTRLLIFIPLMIGATGLIQSRRKFCLAYGFMGTFNLGKLGELSRVANAEDRAADRKTAITILAQAAALAALFTVIFTVLPL